MNWLPDQPASSSDASAARLARQLPRCLSDRGDEQLPQRSPDRGKQLQWKVRRTQAVLVVDRVWPLVWLPLGIAGLFVLVSLLGLWQYLPQDIHRALLWGFGAAEAVSFIPLIRLKWPTRDEALRHMEKAAGLPHRPATSYHDQLAGSAVTPATSRLWAAHRERAAKVFAQLKAGWPHPRIDHADPLALRVLLILALVPVFIAHHSDAGDRVRAAFRLAPATLNPSARLDAWITPPLYTGKPPVMLADGARQDAADAGAVKRVAAPVKSELTVRVNHSSAARFSLRLKPSDGPETTLAPTFVKGKESTAEFKETLTAAGEIQLLDGGEPVARWGVDILGDTPPKITMLDTPSEAQRGSLRFRYKVEDDYGVVSAEALLARGEDGAGDEDAPAALADVKRLGKAPVISLTLPRSNAKQGEGQTYRDLTSHYWAGLPVTVTLEARDQAGQRGHSVPLTVILPERRFNNPLARAIIEQRKRLVDRPDLRVKIAEALDALTIAPEKFVPEIKTYLAIRTAHWRLRDSAEEASLESAADLLWAIAVRIEDGDLSDAERQLRQAQEDLMRALEENAPDHVIKQRMDELRQALNRYLDTMKQQAQNQELDPRQLGDQRVVTSKDLDRMLKQIEDLARTGSKDAARQMLSELRDILENAQPGRQASNQNREMMNMLDGLSEIITKQQKLLDETFRAQNEENMFGGEDVPETPGEQGSQGQQGGQQGGGQQGGKYADLKQRQGDLEKDLRKLMGKLRGMGATPPDQLDSAGQAMGEADKALGNDNAGRAAEQQTLALDKMRQGAKALAEQMMGRMNGNQQGRGTANNNRDPLGRPLPNQGLDDGNSVKVPQEADLQRARQILDELRRRLGERARPPVELDYIERLIERF